MKKILLIGFAFMMSISLTACGGTKEEKKSEVIADKVIEQIEKDLTLNNEEFAKKMMNRMEASGEEMDDATKEKMKEVFGESGEMMDRAREEMNNLKEELPNTMKVMTFYRGCIKDADDKGDAINCYEDADKMSEDLGILDEYEDEEFNADEEFGDWTKEDKKNLLAEIDEGFKMMEQFSQ